VSNFTSEWLDIFAKAMENPYEFPAGIGGVGEWEDENGKKVKIVSMVYWCSICNKDRKSFIGKPTYNSLKTYYAHLKKAHPEYKKPKKKGKVLVVR
jgi:hypothetical protein